GGILERVRLLEQTDAILEGGRGPLSIAGQIEGIPPAAGQRGPQWGAGDVREHPLVEGSRFLIRKATLGIFGRLDANRDGLLPMARLHEMAGEVDRGDARQSAQYLGGLFVQPPSLGSNKVVVNRIATEDVPELIGSRHRPFVHQLLLNQVPQGGDHRGLVLLGQSDQWLELKYRTEDGGCAGDLTITITEAGDAGEHEALDGPRRRKVGLRVPSPTQVAPDDVAPTQCRLP